MKLSQRPDKKIRKKVTQANQNVIFLPGELDQVKMIAARGLTDSEMAELFGITPELWKKWLAVYPSFKRAIEEGRTEPDEKVLAALYKNATGYDQFDSVTVTKTDRRGRKSSFTRKTKKHVPGSVEAQKFWLTNRQPKHWKNRSNSTLDGEVTHRFEERKKIIDGLFEELTTDAEFKAIEDKSQNPESQVQSDTPKEVRTGEGKNKKVEK